VAVADVFDALTHERPYKAAWSVEEAVAEIERQRGQQFDPGVVEHLQRLMPQVREVVASSRGQHAAPAPAAWEQGGSNGFAGTAHAGPPPAR
jgi:putative two-component system response regulator